MVDDGSFTKLYGFPYKEMFERVRRQRLIRAYSLTVNTPWTITDPERIKELKEKEKNLERKCQI